jgi:hypothetical protein
MLDPLVILLAIALPLDEVPELAVTMLRLEDLFNLPLHIAWVIQDWQRLVIPWSTSKGIGLDELELDHWEDRVELGVPWR